MKKLSLIAASMLVATTGIASAASVNSTQSWQAKRIEQGRQSGDITWTEGLKLRAEQNRIARLEAQFRAKGYLTASERRQLQVLQRNASRQIAKEKNDGWSRAWWMPRFGK